MALGYAVAIYTPAVETVGDRIGRRKLLLIGAAAFGVASAIAAFSNSAGMLIAMRALLGIAGATLAPSTMSLIRNMFHEESERQFAIGVWIASFSVGGVIGPLVGGVLLQYFHWSSVFLVAVPVMVALLLLGPILLPEYRDPNAGRLDPASVALSLFAVLATIFGLKRIAEAGFAIDSIVTVVVGIALGFVFIRRQGRLADPLLDMKLFRVPTFSAAIAAYALSCLAMFGVYIFITQYLQLVLDLSPLQAGLATAPWALAFVVGSLLAPRLARRLPAVTVLVGGLVFAAVGFALLLLVDSRIDPQIGLAAMIAGTVVMSLGMAPVFTLGNEMIITAAPPERAGAASAISETSSEFSGALGIALFGSVGTAIYGTRLAVSMPGGIAPESSAEAIATLGGAVAASRSLPVPLESALLDASRGAFIEAMQGAVLAAIVIMIGASWIAARILRKR